MRVVVVGPNLPQQAGGFDYHVHAEGCTDLGRGWIKPHARGEKAFDFASKREVVEFVYSDIIGEREDEGDEDPMEGLDQDFHWAPCVGALPA